MNLTKVRRRKEKHLALATSLSDIFKQDDHERTCKEEEDSYMVDQSQRMKSNIV